MDGVSITRRGLLSKGAVSIASVAAAGPVVAAAINDTPEDLARRRTEARTIRHFATGEATIGRFPAHPTNGDEEGIMNPRYIGNFSKGLPQDPHGIVEADAYEALLHALKTGVPGDFDKIPLGRPPAGPFTAFDGSAHVRMSNGHPISTSSFFSGAADLQAVPAVAGAATESGTVSIAPAAQPRFFRLNSERAASATGQSLLVDPQAALAFDLEGADSHSFMIDPPPSYKSADIIAEIAENYWMALLRDTAFDEFENPNNQLVKSAIDHLNSLDSNLLKVPREGGSVTPKTLFRGTTPGDLVGPYVSQFLLREVTFGAYTVKQQVQFGYPQLANGMEQVFLIDETDWYTAQLGIILPNVGAVSSPLKYNYRPRELCNFVHIDELFQGYLNAELIMSSPPSRGGMGVNVAVGNPYRGSTSQVGFGTLGEPNFASLVAEVATRALKAVWYQKWAVHRRLRPEALAGHIHFKQLDAGLPYPLHQDWSSMLNPVLTAVKAFNADHGGKGLFLPMAFQDGAPSHPAYGAGHATVAGACVTLLKAFYDDTPFSKLVSVDSKKRNQIGAEIYVTTHNGVDLVMLSPETPTDPSRTKYKYDDLKDVMTVHGELNKVASNVSLARNFAGVHWRSDHAASVPLGEKVALKFLQEIVQTYNEDVFFSFNSFAGTPITIRKL